MMAESLLSIGRSVGPYWEGSIDKSLAVQMLCLAEECGEVVQAYRQAAGLTSHKGTLSYDAVARELADVVIVAAHAATLLGADLDTLVAEKLAIIQERDRA